MGKSGLYSFSVNQLIPVTTGCATCQAIVLQALPSIRSELAWGIIHFGAKCVFNRERKREREREKENKIMYIVQ